MDIFRPQSRLGVKNEENSKQDIDSRLDHLPATRHLVIPSGPNVQVVFGDATLHYRQAIYGTDACTAKLIRGVTMQGMLGSDLGPHGTLV